MKKVLLLAVMAIFFVCVNSFSQVDSICGVLPSKNGIVTFDNVVKIDSLSSNKLYNYAKLWISQNFVSSKAVIDSDIENSMISISAILGNNSVENYSFKMNIQFKDNRFKYTITDIILHLKFTGLQPIDKHIEELPAIIECKKSSLIEIKMKFDNLVKGLITSMNKKNDNW